VLLNSHEGYAAFRHSADPQHSVISLIVIDHVDEKPLD
jgi:hypothetical protein